MMNYLKLFFISIIFFANNSIQAQNLNLEWAKSVGGIATEEGNALTVDTWGNVYTVGFFGDSVDFDPSTGVVTKVANGWADIFIQKLDPNGNLLWVQTLGGIYGDEGTGVVTDLMGNVYITGIFRGSVDFNPGLGVATRVTHGGGNIADIFVLKLDSNGNFIWVKTYGNSFDEYASSIAIDFEENILVTGIFIGVVNFGISTTTSIGSNDVFVLKLDSTGNEIWAKATSGNESISANFLTCDALGNVYITGSYLDTVDFDPNTGVEQFVSTDEMDIYILKLDINGNFVWVKTINGITSGMISDWDTGLGIEVDVFGNVFVTGIIEQAVDFDPGIGTATLGSQVLAESYLLKLDSNGDFLWVKSFVGSLGAQGSAVETDLAGNVYVFGYYWETIDANPGVGVLNYTSQGESDLSLIKLDPTGILIWAKTMGGVGHEYGYSMVVDSLDNIYVTGKFEGTFDADPNAGITTLTSNGWQDLYVLKFSQELGLPIAQLEKDLEINFYPNPTANFLNIDKMDNEILSIQIVDNFGRQLYAQQTTTRITKISVENWAAGIYYLMINNGVTSVVEKFIKQ